MSDLQQSRPSAQRPAAVVVAAVLTVVVAVLPVGQLLFMYPFGPSLEMLAPYLVSALASAACWVVTVPWLLRGRSWARVAVTAIAAVSLAQALPIVLNGLRGGSDVVLLLYTVALLAPAAIVALLWSPRPRAWFGPLR